MDQWTISYYGDLQTTIEEFPAGLLARFVYLTERMLEFGPNLGMPHTRSFGKGLFELRLKSKEGFGRVFFFTMVERKIVMLHAFVKKSAKTPTNEMAIARKRMKEVMSHDDPS